MFQGVFKAFQGHLKTCQRMSDDFTGFQRRFKKFQGSLKSSDVRKKSSEYSRFLWVPGRFDRVSTGYFKGLGAGGFSCVIRAFRGSTGSMRQFQWVFLSFHKVSENFQHVSGALHGLGAFL